MNLHALGRLYDQLTPRERLPLLMAAHRRGDAAEYQRLDGSAPKRTFQTSDYYPLAKALGEAGYLHLLSLLDLAGAFWQCWGLWMAAAPPRAPEEDRKERGKPASTVGAPQCPRTAADDIDGSRAWGLMRYYASRFMAHVGGWQQFCAELHIDAEALVKFRIGWDLIAQTEKATRALIFSAEEAAQFVRRQTAAVADDDAPERGPAPVEPVADLARAWHAILEDLMATKELGDARRRA
jgi:hypothetical protein